MNLQMIDVSMRSFRSSMPTAGCLTLLISHVRNWSTNLNEESTELSPELNVQRKCREASLMVHYFDYSESDYLALTSHFSLSGLALGFAEIVSQPIAFSSCS